MWTRRQLKDKAKAAFRVNYWKTVLVALLVTIITGIAMSGGAGSGASASAHRYGIDTSSVRVEHSEEMTDEEMAELVSQLEATEELDADATPEEIVESVGMAMEDAGDQIPGPAIAVMVLMTFMIVLVAIALVFVINAFVINPFEVGFERFFLRNLNQPAQVKEIAHAFDTNYRETVKGMFLRDIYTLLWALLLIIPGIVKAYEYRMIPYLFADDPTMTSDRAFAESRAMMQGNKWRAFVLDLSFLGWAWLSVITLGVVGVFYAAPYQCMTNAALYEHLRYGTPAPQLGTSYVAPAAGMPEQVPVPPFAAADAPEADDSFVAPEDPEA